MPKRMKTPCNCLCNRDDGKWHSRQCPRFHAWEHRTFISAKKKMPACLVGATDHPRTLGDLRFAAEHEVDMFNEGQDGALTPAEVSQVAAFLVWLRSL